jgi:hypothetical protein
MTWLLLYYGMFAVSKKLVIPWLGYSPLGLFILVTFNSLSLLAMYSHFAAMTTDPGAGNICLFAVLLQINILCYICLPNL